ncbi:MAG: AfsR/SARP family transcriptional regulator, partial [Actinobacteria bacterium]|nr:AfsR/SARP family transcriptional regulator [Actinomycetota bacterium]
ALVETIVARLARRRLLLVLDNCEHLLGGCAKLIGALLAGCPQLSILSTSREALGVSSERVWELAALPVPEEAEHEAEHKLEALAGNPAVGLFVERARAVQPDFSLNAYISPAVVEIVRRLDGIPLAIELAAGRVASLTPQEIAGRLTDRFALLSKATDGEPARHQTLAAALDWSYELLTGPERALLRRLSVFAGAFELEAVEAVCAGGEIEARQGAELLAGLAGKSLVLVQAQSPAARYRLLETIRLYAAERLEQAGERAKLRSAHARFYLALAEQAEPELTGAHQEQWLSHLEAERANLRSGIEWSLSQGETEQALRLAGALVLYWRVRCHFSEGRELLD